MSALLLIRDSGFGIRRANCRPLPNPQSPIPQNTKRPTPSRDEVGLRGTTLIYRHTPVLSALLGLAAKEARCNGRSRNDLPGDIPNSAAQLPGDLRRSVTARAFSRWPYSLFPVTERARLKNIAHSIAYSSRSPSLTDCVDLII